MSSIEDEEADSEDQPSRTSASALSIDDAVTAIAEAVNKHLSQNICPDNLAVLPKNLRGDREFEYLSFANITPALPTYYSDVLVRRREIFRSQWSDPEISSYVGTIYRVAGREAAPRSITGIAVIWRQIRDHDLEIKGSRQEKLDEPVGITLAFQRSFVDWAAWPRLADLFPWRQVGVHAMRNWVWAPDPETLRMRWSHLVAATSEDKEALFKSTPDRSLDRSYPPWPDVPSSALPLGQEQNLDPTIVPVAFRSFDRQYLIHDRRVIDRPRPDLWRAHGERQIYVSEQHAHPIKDGAALSFAALVPNVHHFNGRGGRVRPFYRDRLGREPNVLAGLLALLQETTGEVGPEDLLAYVAAVVAHSGYTRRFRWELRTPGVRVPITTSTELWREAVSIGSEVVWLHSYGERYCDESAGRPRTRPRAPAGQGPRLVRAICTSPDAMPDRRVYSPHTQTLAIGRKGFPEDDGIVGQVTPAVWEYRVGGGVPVVRRWLNYRLRSPRHKRRTSPLDQINPSRWSPQFDDELLDLLHVLHRCVTLEPQQADLLDRVRAGPLLTIADLEQHHVLPVPGSARRSRRLPGSNPTFGPETSD